MKVIIVTEDDGLGLKNRVFGTFDNVMIALQRVVSESNLEYCYGLSSYDEMFEEGIIRTSVVDLEE